MTGHLAGGGAELTGEHAGLDLPAEQLQLRLVQRVRRCVSWWMAGRPNPAMERRMQPAPIMRAGEFCMREVVTAEREESVVAAARRMAEFDVGDLIIVDSSTTPAVPVGIVTDRDLVIRVLATQRAPHQVTLGEVMRPDLVTAAEDEELEAVLARLRSHAIRRIPVLDREGRLQGILSLDDVWGWIAEQALSAATLLQRQGPSARPRPDRVQRS